MFSDLQLALAALGAGLLIAVYAFNKWQEHKARKQSERFASRHSDVLVEADSPNGSRMPSTPMAGGRVDHDAGMSRANAAGARGPGGSDLIPAASQPSAITPVQSLAHATESIEHTLGLPPISPARSGTNDAAPNLVNPLNSPSFPDLSNSLNPPNTEVATTVTTTRTPGHLDSGQRSGRFNDIGALQPPANNSGGDDRKSSLDDRVDYLVVLRFSEPHSGEEILRIGEEIVRGAKNVNWDAYDDGAGTWLRVSPVAQYRIVRVGLQLVDRRGSISDEQVVDFCHRVQALAATLVAECDFGSRAQALRIAAELDKLCLDVDIQVGVNVVKSRGAGIAASQVRNLAEAKGCTLGADGQFRLRTPDGADMLTIANLEQNPFTLDASTQVSTRGVTVSIDVPRAPDADASFAQFSGFAQSLAQALNAELVDDNRNPLTPQGLDAIGQAVSRARAALREAGIAAGSPLALRLFA